MVAVVAKQAVTAMQHAEDRRFVLRTFRRII